MSGCWGVRCGREEHLVSCSSLGLESCIQLIRSRVHLPRPILKRGCLSLLAGDGEQGERGEGIQGSSGDSGECGWVLQCWVAAVL